MSRVEQLLILCFSILVYMSKHSNSIDIDILYCTSLRYVNGTVAPRSFGFESVGSAPSLAIEDFKAKGWLHDVNFRFSRIDDPCDPKGAIGLISQHVLKSRPDIIMGPRCSTAMIASALYASHWNITLLPLGGTDAHLGNKSRYDTLVRVISNGGSVTDAVLTMTKQFGWKNVALVYSAGFCEFMGPDLQTRLPLIGVDLAEVIGNIESEPLDYKLREYLERLKERVRVIYFCIRRTTMLQILKLAYELGMYPGYVFLFFSTSTSPLTYPTLTEREHAEWSNIFIKLNFKSINTIRPSGPEIDELVARIPERLAEAPWYWNTSLINGWNGSFRAVDLYDLTTAYLIVLNETLMAGKGREYFSSGKYIQNQLKGRSFGGMLPGKLRFDARADRITDSRLWSHGKDTMEPVATVHPGGPGEDQRFVYVEVPFPLWDTENNEAPPDTPICGFHGELCSEDSYDIATILITTLSIALCILGTTSILGYIIYKKKQEESILRHLWEINIDDLKIIDPHEPEKMSLSNSVVLLNNGDDLADLQVQGAWGQAYRDTVASDVEMGYYKDKVVSVFRCSIPSVMLARIDLLELKSMCEMRHENIAPFLGASTVRGRVCFIMIHYQKGSLQDIIDNDDIRLDWSFKNSLVADLASGLSYLHNSILGSHGNLTSTCCFLDDRWQLKISGYGLSAFQADDSVYVGDDEYYSALLWSAPELLRADTKPRNGTKEGDIYSFAIITHEIVFRTTSFGTMETISPQEIIKRVKDIRQNPYRPQLEDMPEDTNQEVVKLMQLCWVEDPQKRPTCVSVSKKLLSMNEGKKVDIMESMVAKLEKYANDLEDLVNRRTMELVNEKMKTDTLLYRMLPESVAEDLKRGQAVKAELFDQVTVYFSDIVGFVDLLTSSSPIEIVDLLNDLYSMFDETISHFDVYKVETINDSYMVVSGLPRPNGRRHVAEIADLALELMSTVITVFRIRHKPHMTLQLRIGFHTGPCAAGVVGISMPRYCLFGDTVNMASRMETYGQALKIHLSRSAYAALSVIRGYTIVPRGELNIKGKGLQMTYWLVGRENSQMPLPTLTC